MSQQSNEAKRKTPSAFMKRVGDPKKHNRVILKKNIYYESLLS